jgi:DNA-binding SARP family transcriptional activator
MNVPGEHCGAQTVADHWMHAAELSLLGLCLAEESPPMSDQRVDAPQQPLALARTEPALICVQTLGDFHLFLAWGAVNKNLEQQAHQEQQAILESHEIHERHERQWIEATPYLPRGHGRARELLILLLDQRRALQRAAIAQILWPEADEARRKSLLRLALSNLRAVLTEAHQGVLRALRAAQSDENVVAARLGLQETATTVRLIALAPIPSGALGALTANESASELGLASEAPVVSAVEELSPTPPLRLLRAASETTTHLVHDVFVFVHVYRQIQATQTPRERLRWCQEALAIYTGPFLPGYASGWVGARREQLERHWAQTRIAAANAWWQLGESERALHALYPVLEQLPYHEDAARMAITLLANRGAMMEALELAEGARRAFRERYGDESANLRRLASDIRAGRFVAEQRERLSSNSGSLRPKASPLPLDEQ